MLKSPTLMENIETGCKVLYLLHQTAQSLFLNFQQHSSVYWKKGTKTILGNMQPDKSMYEQLKVFNFFFDHFLATSFIT
jgi:hypothetical protein